MAKDVDLDKYDVAQLLAFIGQLAPEERGGGAMSASEYAKEKGWLTQDGAFTDDGRKLLEALMEQSSTRSVFRSF